MKKVIFIHVPRTAGSSITKAASIVCKATRLRTNRIRSSERFDFISTLHGPIPHLIKINSLSQSMYDEAFKFAFVRNPWDRLVSVWKHYKSFRRRKKQVIRLTSLDVFVEEVLNKNYRMPNS